MLQEGDEGAMVGQLHRMYTGEITNAVQIAEPLGDYELMCAMLLPLYAARAAEETFFGPRGVTLATAPEVSSLFVPAVITLLTASAQQSPS